MTDATGDVITSGNVNTSPLRRMQSARALVTRPATPATLYLCIAIAGRKLPDRGPVTGWFGSTMTLHVPAGVALPTVVPFETGATGDEVLGDRDRERRCQHQSTDTNVYQLRLVTSGPARPPSERALQLG